MHSVQSWLQHLRKRGGGLRKSRKGLRRKHRAVCRIRSECARAYIDGKRGVVGWGVSLCVLLQV